MGAESWIEKVLFTSAGVTAVTDVADGFRLIDLEGDALAKKQWAPGDKVQVHASRFAMRTYTPVDWDTARGRTKLLAFVHGEGPGARWARDLRRGDTCAFFGPRKSVPLAKLGDDIVLFGDETSIGVGASLRALRPQSSRLIFEAVDASSVEKVVGSFVAGEVTVVPRTPGEAHLQTVADRIAQAPKDTTVVLTGRASSIVRLRQLLREARTPATVRAKAYWAEGRTGLD